MLQDLRRSPATLTLATLWVAIFLIMQESQGKVRWEANPFSIGSLGVSITHQFGDATTAELAAGQIWRAITSTFIHYNALHLVLNLFGLIQLGILAEHWYGSAQLLLIYVLIGGLGNLLAGFARPYFGIPPYVHCGGGSTVVFGLIGLCAMVGWRSKTPEGRELGWWMAIFLLINVLMGFGLWLFNTMLSLGLPNFDHLAHAGGTLFGCTIGLFHRTLRKLAWRPAAQALGMAAALVLVASMGAQGLTNRAELRIAEDRAVAKDRWQTAERSVAALLQLDLFYRMAALSGISARRGMLLVRGVRGNMAVQIPSASQLKESLVLVVRQLESSGSALATGPTAADFQRLVRLAEAAESTPPTEAQLKEFQTSLTAVLKRAEQDYRDGMTAFLKLSQPPAATKAKK